MVQAAIETSYRLLAGFFIGPVAWGLNLEINDSLVKWACASGTPQALPLLSLGALLIVTAGALHFIVSPCE